MAKDNDNDKNKGSDIKSPELLNPDKDTQQERLDGGKRRVPKEGQTWADINNAPRVDIKKPDIYYEAMKAKEADKQIDKPKQLDKDKDHDKDHDKD